MPKCRFFVVPGDSPTLLGMPDTELLNILKIMCEVMGDPHESRKSDLQTMKEPNSHNCKTIKAQLIKTDNEDVNDANINIPDYFRLASTEQQKKEQVRH